MWRKRLILSILITILNSILTAPTAIGEPVSLEDTQRLIGQLSQVVISTRDSLFSDARHQIDDDQALAPKTAFENDADYVNRLLRVLPSFGVGYRHAVLPLWEEIRQLRAQRFPTSNLSIIATPERYDANTGIWTVVIVAVGYTQEHVIQLDLPRDQAKVFHDHLSDVQLSGEMAIDVDGQVRLAKVSIDEEVSDVHRMFDLQPFFVRAESLCPDRLCFSPDGRKLHGAASFSLWTLDLITGRCKNSGSYYNASYLDIEELTGLIALSNSNKVEILAPDGSEIWTITSPTPGSLSSIAWIPGGGAIAAMTEYDFYIFDVKTQAPILRMREVCNPFVDPLGRFVVLADLKLDSFYTRHNFVAGDQQILFPYKGILEQDAMSPDGSYYAAIQHNDELYLYDLNSKRRITLPILQQEVEGVAFSYDGTEIALGFENAGVQIFNLQSRQRIATVPAPGAPRVFTFHPDGSTLAVRGSRQGGTVALYRIDRVGPEAPKKGKRFND